MIEAWIDPENNEVTFIEGGRIQLHLKTGTISKESYKIMDIQTNSMSEAHRIFRESLRDNLQIHENNREEGWD